MSVFLCPYSLVPASATADARGTDRLALLEADLEFAEIFVRQFAVVDDAIDEPALRCPETVGFRDAVSRDYAIGGKLVGGCEVKVRAIDCPGGVEIPLVGPV